jgi:hypothetical protein
MILENLLIPCKCLIAPLYIDLGSTAWTYRDANSCPKFVPCRAPRVKMPYIPDTLYRDLIIYNYTVET